MSEVDIQVANCIATYDHRQGDHCIVLDPYLSDATPEVCIRGTVEDLRSFVESLSGLLDDLGDAT